MANTDVTLGNNFIFPANNQEKLNGFTHSFAIGFADVAVGAGSTDTVTVTLLTLPTKYLITKCIVDLTTFFAGSTGGFTIQVGTVTDPNNFIAATTVKTATAIINPAIGGAPLTLAGSSGVAGGVLEALFTSDTSGAPEDMTSGALMVHIGISDLSLVD